MEASGVAFNLNVGEAELLFQLVSRERRASISAVHPDKAYMELIDGLGRRLADTVMELNGNG